MERCYCGNPAPVFGVYSWDDDGTARTHNGGICLNCALHDVRRRLKTSAGWWVAKWRQTWREATPKKRNPFALTVGERGAW